MLLFGEVLPKIFANNNSKLVAKKMSMPINIISKIVSPLSYLLIKLTGFLNNSFEKYKENPSIENLSKAVTCYPVKAFPHFSQCFKHSAQTIPLSP